MGKDGSTLHPSERSQVFLFWSVTRHGVGLTQLQQFKSQKPGHRVRAHQLYGLLKMFIVVAHGLPQIKITALYFYQSRFSVKTQIFSITKWRFKGHLLG
jgi:hypothetical protein